ncbi:MAG: metallophosphoesterase [Acidobacteriota bacterium]|nr:metallophosphoesterase [Acidobacteriota bacterium]
MTPLMWRIVAIGATWTAAWWLIIGAFIAGALPGGWLTILSIVGVIIVPLIVLVQRFRGAYPSAFTRLFIFRPFWYVQLASPLVAIGGVAGFLTGLPFGIGLVAARWAVVVVVSLVAIGAIAGYIGSRVLRVKSLEARFSHLPGGLIGLRIVQISDVHVGPHTSKAFLGRISRAVTDAAPDLIVITGDQVDDYAEDVARFAAAFAGLRAPLGVFAVAGNHDVYAGWAHVHRGMSEMGTRVLVNEAVQLWHRGVPFWLGGTGDPAGFGGPLGPDRSVAPDVPRTVSSIPAGAFTIVLAHNPALWPSLAERGVDLTLSGHTHYGQLSIPRIGWSLASLRWTGTLAVSRCSTSTPAPTTGAWPLRLGALPEVTIITLARTAGGAPEIIARSPVR